MMLIIGKSTIGEALQRKWTDSLIVERPEYDFSCHSDCDRLVSDYPSPNVVINTLGCNGHDVWNNLVINFVAPVYLTTKYLSVTGCHIINISNASAWWPHHAH